MLTDGVRPTRFPGKDYTPCWPYQDAYYAIRSRFWGMISGDGRYNTKVRRGVAGHTLAQPHSDCSMREFRRVHLRHRPD